MIVLLIALVVVAVLVIWTVATYNSLVGTRNRAEEALGALDAHLKQRYDLIPNLVETVKGYAAHEEETLSRVIGARNAAMSSSPARCTISSRSARATRISRPTPPSWTCSGDWRLWRPISSTPASTTTPLPVR